MHLGTHHRPPSRIAMRIVLLLALAAASITLTQCRMVGDRLTGVSVGTYKWDKPCFDQCRDEYKTGKEAEVALHVQYSQACNDDPVCQQAEDERHEAEMARLDAEFYDCISNCHTQGSGTTAP